MSVQASQIPDLLKIGSIPVNTAQDVETAVLEPVVHSDTFCRFVFQNKGILHSHSKIEIGLNNVGEQAILPIGVGIYSLIERVALKMGTKTICEIEDFAHWYAYKSLFVANENNKERELYQNGRAIAHAPQYEDALINVGDAQGSGESNTLAGNIGIDWGRDYKDSRNGQNPALDPDMNLKPLDWMLLRQEQSDDNQGNPAIALDDDAPTWQLSLSELCPFLKMNQLPLYMIKEQVSLELTFTPARGTDQETAESRRVVQVRTDAGTTPAPATPTINTAKTRLIADYLYFPQEMMEAYANANANMSFTYVDYQLSKQSVNRADLQEQGIRNIGGAGRIVSKLFWGIQDEFAESEYLLGNYYSQGPQRTYTNNQATDNNGTATFNLKYNDNFLYPIDVDNSARHFYNVQSTEGLVPFVNREEYCGEGDALTDRKVCGWKQGGNGADQGNANARQHHANLVSKFFWNGARLNKNQRINSRGIELYYKVNRIPPLISRTDGAGNVHTSPGYTQRVYMEVVRTATLNNGYFQCYFA